MLGLSQIKGNGGIPRFNRNLIEACDHHHELRVLSQNDASTGHFQGFKGNRILFALNVLWQLLVFKPQTLLIGHLNFVPLAIFKRFFPVQVVVVLHGIEAWKKRKKLGYFMSMVDEYWAVSEYTQKTFGQKNDIPAERVKKIFNTLPSDWEDPDCSIEYRNFFLTVTRLEKSEPYKNVDKVIQAIALNPDFLRDRNWNYIIVAAGSAVQTQKKLVEKLQISDLVQFCSNLSDAELKEMYSKCSFFILPSTGEGFGIVFLEAMAYAKACIGANDCGTTDVIDDGQSGFLVHPDIHEIREKLEILIADESLCKKMASAGYQKLQISFTFPNFKNLINKLLECVE